MDIRMICGDCYEGIDKLIAEGIQMDAVVTDPPYGWKFMGRKWDYDIPTVELWEKVMKILKPGGHALVFCGTRTQHRMAVNLEDAGFEIRDLLAWVYGSGFPKSMDVSKAIDMKACREDFVKRHGRKPTKEEFKEAWGKWRKVTGEKIRRGDKKAYPYKDTDEYVTMGKQYSSRLNTLPETDLAKQWQGWGTALKPAMELITLCRKPLAEETIAENVLRYGTGGINIDKSRIESENIKCSGNGFKSGKYGGRIGHGKNTMKGVEWQSANKGRWPTNLIHDGSEEVLELFPDRNWNDRRKFKIGRSKKGAGINGGNCYGKYNILDSPTYGDKGSAARFFYCAKASSSERGKNNKHPTVKPLKLIQYLCRLITPPGGTVLDPFMGSGTTGMACELEGFHFIGIELEEEYVKIANERLKKVKGKMGLFGGEEINVDKID